MAVEETENAAGDQSPAITSTRTVDIVVSLILLALATLLAVDNWRTGMSWDASGPQAGYFPFYLSLILGAASIYGLVKGFIEPATEPFVTREQLTRVLQMFVPTFLFVVVTQWLGLYVASFILIVGFMTADRPHRAVEVTADVGNFHGAHVYHVRDRLRRHHAEGPDRSPAGLLRPRDGSTQPARPWLHRPDDVEDAHPDDGGPRPRHFRRCAAGAGRTERRRDPSAADFLDGSDLGHCDAVVHLLGRAVRRCDHVHIVQYSRRGVVGGHHVRRVSDGAEGPGGRSADRSVHLVIHRLARRGDAYYVPGTERRRLRLALRSA